MKDHEITQTVNVLRDIAVKFHDHQSLRERIAQVIVDPLKRIRILEQELLQCRREAALLSPRSENEQAETPHRDLGHR